MWVSELLLVMKNTSVNPETSLTSIDMMFSAFFEARALGIHSYCFIKSSLYLRMPNHLSFF